MCNDCKRGLALGSLHHTERCRAATSYHPEKSFLAAAITIFWEKIAPGSRSA